jgi:hypothetical protein
MTPTTQTDPFSATLQALWGLLLADKGFAALCRPGNQVRFDDAQDRQPLKPQTQAADLPEVIIMPGAGTSTAGVTSSSHRIVKNWTIQIDTGDQRFAQILAPLQFRVFAVLANSVDVLPGCDFVKKLRLMTDQDILVTGNEQQVPRGWRLVAGVMTELWLPRTGGL